MGLGRSKKVAAGIGVGVLLSGGAGAFAATQLASNPRQAYVNDVAHRLHVTPAALTNAMKAARIDQINAAQKAGKLSAAQASAAKSRIKSGRRFGLGGLGLGPKPGFGPGAFKSMHGASACGGPLTPTTGTGTATTSTTPTPAAKSRWGCGAGAPFGPRGFRHFFRCGASSTATSATTTSTTTTTTTRATTSTRPCPAAKGFWWRAGPGAAGGVGLGLGLRLFGVGESAVTSYLGITAGTLRSDLASGKTLAQITTATSGKSVSGLEAAVTAAAKTALDKAVSAGTITSARETKALSTLSKRLAKLVNLSFKMPAGAHRMHAWSP